MVSHLLQLIENKEKLNSETAKNIVQELVTPDFFSEQEAEKIARWYKQLTPNDKGFLLASKDFSQALEYDFNRDECCVFSEKQIDEIFSETTYKLSNRTMNWLKNNIFFPKIKLSSGVQIQTDARAFFKTLADGLDVFPHLIDELKKASILIPCLYMVPCNYTDMLGSCRLNSFQIKLNNDTYNETTLKNLLHEIGHASAIAFRNKQENMPLIYFTDEAEQYAKTTYIELFQENLEDNPLLSLGQYIYKQVRQKYPALSDEKIERATAILTKREIIWLHLLRNEQLRFVLQKWKENGILDNHTDFSYDYANLIAYRWDFYTQYYSVSQSLYKNKEEFKKKLIKRYGEPQLITKYLSKRDLLSGDFCAELMGRAGFVDVPDESLKYFYLNRVYFKPHKTLNNILFFRAYIDCKNFSSETIKKIKKAYADYGACLKYRNNHLYTDSVMATRQVYKLISNDFSNSPMRLGHPFFVLDRKKLSEHIDNELSMLLDNAPITSIANEEQIIVDKVQLNQHGYTFDAPVCGGCIWQVEDDFSNPEKIEACMKRWQQKGFHPHCMPLTEKYVLFLFPEKEIEPLNAYYKKVQFALSGLNEVPQSAKGIPNPLITPKGAIRKKITLNKTHIRE